MRTKGPAHEAALQLAEMNLFGFPCEAKTPVVAGWTEGQPNRPLVDAYFRNRPDANLGLRTGNGLFAVDLDKKHNGEAVWADFLRKRKLPPTATALTPGGGRHILFRAPARCVIKTRSAWRGMPGVDIRGHHGFVVIEPSIIIDPGPPERERQYVWLRTPHQGIAKAPSWLLDELVDEPKVATRPLGPARSGDAARLAARLIEKFPVLGPGRHNGAFSDAVPSLVGSGYDDETVLGAIEGWWTHFFEAGAASSPFDRARTEGYIRSIRANKNFGILARTQDDHLATCRRIFLPDSVKQAIEGPTKDPHAPLCILDSIRSNSPLALTPSEAAFVEAILVATAHEVELGRGGLIHFTNAQVHAIAADRHPGAKWAPPQMERLKAKFIDRPDKPASRAPLLRQVETGCKAMKGKPASVSAYEVLDLAPLLAHCVPAWASPLWYRRGGLSSENHATQEAP